MRRRFGRRRRSPVETYTIVQCEQCVNVYGDMTCTSPLTVVTELMTMRTPRSIADATEVSNPADRAIVVKGIKFGLEYEHNPNDTQNQGGNCDPDPFAVAMNLRVWEAIVVLPLAQGTAQVPAYIPSLSSANFQGGDLADRVLWKRLSILPIWGILTTGAPQLEATMRDVDHGLQVVKSKVRLDDRHGLYLVQCFVHNVLFGRPGAFPCAFGDDNCIIPINFDAWFKVFYTTRK